MTYGSRELSCARLVATLDLHAARALYNWLADFIGRPTFDESILKKLDSLHSAGEAKAREISAAIKAQVSVGDRERPGETVRRLVTGARKLQAEFLREVRHLQRSAGISEAEIRAIERAYESERLPRDTGGYWHNQVLQARSSDDLDHEAAVGLESLLRRVDPKWLRAQAEKPYRLQDSFLIEPLHLVSGVRVGVTSDSAGPQRFARMLLLCDDHLKKDWDLDFFAAAMFVPEAAMLGSSVREIDALGPEAQRKFAALPSMTDSDVTATVYELLVGSACLRRGLDVEMVAEDRAQKVPDYRITGLGAIPGAIECKRRLGLTQYELSEAAHVAALYESVRWLLWERRAHCSIEVSFHLPVRLVCDDDFAADVRTALGRGEGHEAGATRWGTLAVRPLPYSGDVPLTRLYSPDFLQRVFGWDPMQVEWDGLLCQVRPPATISVESFRMPVCMKWKSESEEALTKRARGITSLWSDAVKQIPDGEIGFVYVGYPEGARPSVADARTQHILASMGKFWHRWSVRVPATVINRLYPRAVGGGCPDLIESAIGGAGEGQEFWLTKLPWLVFTNQAR